MRRLILACASILAYAAAAEAQPQLFSTQLAPNPSVSVNLTVNGTAGQSFAIIGSNTWGGFSYAGVDLAVGTDVTILATGVLNGAGVAVVPFTPPFPARDRFYLQAVTSPSPAFATITPSNRVTLSNNQATRLYMPIGGLVSANGAVVYASPGVTVSKAGSVYTISHPGQFEYNSPIPTISPTTNATITSIQSTFAQTIVTMSVDAGFSFTIQTVR